MEQIVPNEILWHIGQLIPDGQTWKSWIMTCRETNLQNTEERLLQYANPLWSLIKAEPDRNWDWLAIAASPWTTLDIICDMPWTPFNWSILMINCKFTNEFLTECIDCMADFPIDDEYDWELYAVPRMVVDGLHLLIYNKHIPIDFIKDHPGLIEHLKLLSESGIGLYHPCCDVVGCQNNIQHMNDIWCELSAHVVYESILENTDLPWCPRHICANETFDMKLLDKCDLDFELLSNSPFVTTEIFGKYLMEDWDIHTLSHNPATTVEFLEIGIDEDWDYEILSGSKDINRMMRRFPDAPWDINTVSYNEALDPNLVLEMPDLEWNMFAVSAWSKVDLHFVKDHLDLGWDFIRLLQNENIPFETFLKEFELLPNGLLVHNSMIDTEWFDDLVELDVYDIGSNELYAPSFVLSQRNMTMDELLDNPEIDWDYAEISAHKGLSWVYIRDHPDLGWDWQELSKNKFI